MYDLNEIPFSMHGSYLAVSRMKEHFEGLNIRTVRNRQGIIPVFRIDMLNEDNSVIEFEEFPGFGGIMLSAEGKYLKISFQDTKTIRFGGNVKIKLTMDKSRFYSYANYYPGKRAEFTFGNNYKIMVSPVKGNIEINAPFDRVNCEKIEITCLPDGNGYLDFSLEEFMTAYVPKQFDSVENCISRREADFDEWMEKTLDVKPCYTDTARICSFVNYISVVEPDGHIKRPSMYMSKNWMTNIWCWDRCFNVLSLAKKNTPFAMEQYLALFDHQNESGCLPDCVNDQHIIYDYVKTPLEGWALTYIMKHTDYLTDQMLAKLYGPLRDWTDWWFNYRDYDKDGLPQYNSGLDSGWDNNAIFAGGNLVEAPDLISFLIIQMDALSLISKKLDRIEESIYWKERSDRTYEKFIEHSWDGERFLPLRSGEHAFNDKQDSLMNFVPLILGERLDKGIRNKLISGLKENGRFICDFGITTEGMNSEYFDPEGYWSGPVWGPATAIMVYGLVASNEMDLAKDIAKKYCDNMVKNGTSENFNPKTGKAQEDRAYTWTTSSFLILASFLESGEF